MRAIRFLMLILSIAPLMMSFSFFKPKQRDYADIAREIRADVGKKLAKKHQMDVIAVSGGMMGSVYLIGLSFQIHHPMDREEARERIIDCVEELLAAVNANQEIRPFLKDYPFTTKNVDLAIFTNYPDGKEVFDPYIRVVSIYESDEIDYATKEPNKVPYKNEYREPYSEALAKLNHAKLNNHCKGCPNHPANLTTAPPASKNTFEYP